MHSWNSNQLRARGRLAHGGAAVAFEHKSHGLCFRDLVSLGAIQLDADGDTGFTFGWINIAKVGEWSGHPSGAFEFTTEVFQTLIANAEKRQTPINFDYEHQSFDPDVTGPKPSSGEVRRLELRADGKELWAYVRWTPRATQLIRAGEYRSCSPVINFERKDRKSGKPIGADLLSVALTNDPFLDGLHPVQLTRAAANSDGKPSSASAVALVTKPEATAMADAPAAEDDKNKPKTDDGKTPEDGKTKDVAATDAPASDGGGSDATPPDASAVISAIAEKYGLSVSEVIGALMDGISKLEPVLKGDGMPSEMRATDKHVDALKIQLREQTSRITALTDEVKALNTAAKKREEDDKAAAAKAKADADKAAQVALHDKVKKLQDETKVGKSQQDFDDAVALFTLNPGLAERTYANPRVPLGESIANKDPARAAGTETVTLEGLSERERNTVSFLMNTGIEQKKALEAVAAQRGGKAA